MKKLKGVSIAVLQFKMPWKCKRYVNLQDEYKSKRYTTSEATFHSTPFLQDKRSNKIYGTKHISPTPLLEAGEKTLRLSENPFVRR